MTDYPLHEVDQKICEIEIACAPDFEVGYKVGGHTRIGDVTRIEATGKPGEYSNVPYVRVWVGETCIAEFCQHKIVGVYFFPPETSKEITS